MTTIAYKAGIIAADTGMTAGGLRNGHMTKIARNGRGDLAGACGDAAFASRWLSWFEISHLGVAPMPEIVKESAERDNGKGLIIRTDGAIEIYESGGMFTARAPFFAIGSGRAEACGAMFAGADAVGAIKAARALDDGTWGDIENLGYKSGRVVRVRV